MLKKIQNKIKINLYKFALDRQLFGMILNASDKYEHRRLLEKHAERPIFSLSPFYDLDTEDYGLTENRFDFIFSFDILQELINPGHYLGQLSKSLRWDGLFVLTPTFRNGSFNRFNARNLRQIFFKAGFWNIKI